MMGTVAYLTTRAPTWQEIRNCPHVIMTDDKEWDPLTLDLRPRSKEEEEYTRIVSSVRTDRVDINALPSEPQVWAPMQETDVILSSVSSALCDKTMVPRLIASVKVATYIREDETKVDSMMSNQRHSTVDAEELSRK